MRKTTKTEVEEEDAVENVETDTVDAGTGEGEQSVSLTRGMLRNNPSKKVEMILKTNAFSFSIYLLCA